MMYARWLGEAGVIILHKLVEKPEASLRIYNMNYMNNGERIFKNFDS